LSGLRLRSTARIRVDDKEDRRRTGRKRRRNTARKGAMPINTTLDSYFIKNKIAQS
jgi:hypothetical protein